VQPSPNETLTFSPLRESDSTDDTIPRLYFGPQTSPEKRLIKAMITNDDNTPHRRSARLSSPALTRSPPPMTRPAESPAQQLDLLTENDTLEALDSGCETPDNNQDFQDGEYSICFDHH
jgi:hypothetical protein